MSESNEKLADLSLVTLIFTTLNGPQRLLVQKEALKGAGDCGIRHTLSPYATVNAIVDEEDYGSCQDVFLVPDWDSLFFLPGDEKTACLFCDVMDCIDGEATSFDTRSVAGRADNFLGTSGFMGDGVPRSTWTVELCFYLFEGAEITSGSKPLKRLPEAFQGKVSKAFSENLELPLSFYEVNKGQSRLGFSAVGVEGAGDAVTKAKLAISTIAESMGMYACFVPKVSSDLPSSRMRTQINIAEKTGDCLFAGERFAELSDGAIWFIGGILKHAKALNGCTNPTTNSYRGLAPGFDSPVLRAYSLRSSCACVRIPPASDKKTIEVPFLDASADPYLAFSAVLMAGLDGIQAKVHPGEPLASDLYSLSPERLAEIPTLCATLREAIEGLDTDKDFLSAGEVFGQDTLLAFMEMVWGRVYVSDRTVPFYELRG